MSSEENLWFEDLGFKQGAVLHTGKFSYVIGHVLGEGGFGVVLKVYDKLMPQLCYALKVEKRVKHRIHPKLKMEVTVLKALNKGQKLASDRKHFTAMFDRGKTKEYYFLIMQLVGKSLQDLKRRISSNTFTISTGLGVSMQCLEAIEILHRIGFIHRDVKPSNYACGLADQTRTIYILDFGMARRIINEKGELKTPRAETRFKGTLRFASIACHEGMEMSYKDDVESWFYLLLDLILLEGLPWKHCFDKQKVHMLKKDFRQVKLQIQRQEEYQSLLRYIDVLQYTDQVDYRFIYRKIGAIAVSQGLNLQDPYDFE